MSKIENSAALIALARTNIETAALAVAHTGVVPIMRPEDELDWYDAPPEPVCEYRFEPGSINQHRLSFVVTDKGTIDVFPLEYEDVLRLGGVKHPGSGRTHWRIEANELDTIEGFLRLTAAGAFAVKFFNFHGFTSIWFSGGPRLRIDPARLDHPLLVGREFAYFNEHWILDRSKLGRYTQIVNYEPWGLADTTHVLP